MPGLRRADPPSDVASPLPFGAERDQHNLKVAMPEDISDFVRLLGRNRRDDAIAHAVTSASRQRQNLATTKGGRWQIVYNRRHVDDKRPKPY